MNHLKDKCNFDVSNDTCKNSSFDLQIRENQNNNTEIFNISKYEIDDIVNGGNIHLIDLSLVLFMVFLYVVSFMLISGVI